MSFRFETCAELTTLKELFALPASEWAGPFTPAEFASIEAKKAVDHILAGNPTKGFILRDKTTNQVAASCVVAHNKALFKEPALSSMGDSPDPASFGVKNATGLLVSFVFVAKEHRGKGLMSQLLKKAIKHTEDELLQRELAKSGDSKDSFRSMVQEGRDVDSRLANHYLGKKYFWYLYSAVGPAYNKLGFKEYPLEGFQIGFDFGERESARAVEALLREEKIGGKSLHLLDGGNPQDAETLAHIVNGSELALLTEMNKNSFHSELSGSRRSSSSLTNLQNVLGHKLGSNSSLAGVSTGQIGSGANLAGGMSGLNPRSGSVSQFACGKFAVVPAKGALDNDFFTNREMAKRHGTAQNIAVADIRGAVLTNDLQNKTFYVLWKRIKQTEFHIVSMGEMKSEFCALGRRHSSFSGINDMGGYNFQDLELLLATAVHIAKQEPCDRTGVVNVALNDLPPEIPAQVLHDFFMNYLKSSQAVTFVPDFATNGTLPMVRKFGSFDPKFELDWVSNSLVTWG